MHLSSGFQKNFVESSTPLNKANLLSDTTINLIGGLSPTASPNSAIYQLKRQLNTLTTNTDNKFNSQIVIGSKSVTLDVIITNLSVGSTTVTLGFKPKLVLVFSDKNTKLTRIPTYLNWQNLVETSVRVITEATSESDPQYPNYGDYGVTAITNTGFTVVFSAYGSNTAGSFIQTIYYVAFKGAS